MSGADISSCSQPAHMLAAAQEGGVSLPNGCFDRVASLESVMEAGQQQAAVTHEDSKFVQAIMFDECSFGLKSPHVLINPLRPSIP